MAEAAGLEAVVVALALGEAVGFAAGLGDGLVTELGEVATDEVGEEEAGDEVEVGDEPDEVGEEPDEVDCGSQAAIALPNTTKLIHKLIRCHG